MYSIAGLELDAENYSQILRWSKDLEVRPDALINSFIEFSVDKLLESSFDGNSTFDELKCIPAFAKKFEIRDGKIVRLVWDATMHSIEALSKITIDSLEIIVVFGDVAFENIDVDQYPNHSISINQPKLEILVLHKAGISDIKIQKAPSLKMLICPYNCIAEIEFIKTPDLSHLVLDENPIELGFQVALTQLEVLSLSYDLHMDIFSEKILDVSKHKRLQKLRCSGYGIKHVSLPFSSSLVELHLDGNKLSHLDIENSSNLKHLSCSSNELKKLRILNLEGLLFLDCSHNEIDHLDTGNNRQLLELHVYGNKLRSLDISKNDLLIVLNCGSNNIKSIDISNQTFLQQFFCFNTPIEQLNLAFNVELVGLECRRTNVKELDVRNLSDAIVIRCNPEVVVKRGKKIE